MMRQAKDSAIRLSPKGFSVTDDSTFTLYEGLTVALTTSSQVGLVRSPYYKVIVTESVVSGMFIGVPQLAISANYYFWCLTGGPGAVVMHAACALGTPITVGTTAAKADPVLNAAGDTVYLQLVIGWAMTPGVADTESCIVFLTSDR